MPRLIPPGQPHARNTDEAKALDKSSPERIAPKHDVLVVSEETSHNFVQSLLIRVAQVLAKAEIRMIGGRLALPPFQPKEVECIWGNVHRLSGSENRPSTDLRADFDFPVPRLHGSVWGRVPAYPTSYAQRVTRDVVFAMMRNVDVYRHKSFRVVQPESIFTWAMRPLPREVAHRILNSHQTPGHSLAALRRASVSSGGSPEAGQREEDSEHLEHPESSEDSDVPGHSD